MSTLETIVEELENMSMEPFTIEPNIPKKTYRNPVKDFGYWIWTIYKRTLVNNRNPRWIRYDIKEKLSWHNKNIGRIYKKGSLTLPEKFNDCTFLRFGANRNRRHYPMNYEHIFIVPNFFIKMLEKKYMRRLIPNISYTLFRKFNQRVIEEMECFFPGCKTVPPISRDDSYKCKKTSFYRDGKESKVVVYYCEASEFLHH